MPYTLTAILPKGNGPEFSFNAEDARLGRTSDNDIVVKDPNASRSHCRVFVKAGQHWLEDQSANGTMLNGKSLHGSTAKLEHGDKFSIGQVTFSFTVQASPSTEIPKYEFDESSTVIRGSDARLTDPEAVKVQTSLVSALKPKPRVDERERSTRRAPVGSQSAPAAPPPPPPPQPVPSTLAATLDLDDEPEASTGPDQAPPPPKREPVLEPPSTKGKPTTLIRRTELEAASSAAAASVAAMASPSSTLEDPPAEPASDPAQLPPPPKAELAPVAPSVVPVAQPADEDRVRVRRGKETTGEEDSELFEPTAADKARMRRDAKKTALGRISLGWKDLPPLWKGGVVLIAVAVVGGVGAFAWSTLAPAPLKELPREPSELVSFGQPIELVFGNGAGVDYVRPDLKSFDFKAVSPTRLVGLLHYQARDIGKDEVAIFINAQDLGFIPPDTASSAERVLEVVLPADQIKRNETNKLVFDNVRNPPGDEAWAVFNVSLTLLPLPELSSAETANAVREDLARAQKFYDLKDIGPDSLFNAWRAYRDAWLKLESMPGRPTDLYAIARGQHAETWRLLDRKCRVMQIDVQRALTKTKPDYATARIVLKDMLRYFPTGEHPCNPMVKGMLEQLEQ